MKKKIEKISDSAVSQLAEIGQLVRQHRKSFKITANAAAETAGISRVTLHRIEKGEASVSMGAQMIPKSGKKRSANLFEKHLQKTTRF